MAPSWLHEIRRLFQMYLIVALCFVPGGLILALLAVRGMESKWIAICVLIPSLIASQLVWNLLEKNTATHVVSAVEPCGASSNAILLRVPATAQAGLAASASFCVLLVIVGHKGQTVLVPQESDSNVSSTLEVVSFPAF